MTSRVSMSVANAVVCGVDALFTLGDPCIMRDKWGVTLNDCIGYFNYHVQAVRSLG